MSSSAVAVRTVSGLALKREGAQPQPWAILQTALLEGISDCSFGLRLYNLFRVYHGILCPAAVQMSDKQY